MLGDAIAAAALTPEKVSGDGRPAVGENPPPLLPMAQRRRISSAPGWCTSQAVSYGPHVPLLPVSFPKHLPQLPSSALQLTSSAQSELFKGSQSLRVPDIEGSQKNKCQLTRTPYGWRFANEDINSYFAFLLELIVGRGPSVGLNVSLSRYDLFHGQLFLASGILFHAKEYPAFDKELSPYNLGYCQEVYDHSMNLRNILWLAPLPSNVTKAWLAPGILVVLDAHPDEIIYQEMTRDYVQVVRTIYEDDFGQLAADVNYLNVAKAAPADRIFIC